MPDSKKKKSKCKRIFKVWLILKKTSEQYSLPLNDGENKAQGKELIGQQCLGGF